MNTLEVYNLTLKYANNILARKFPEMPVAERKAAARKLAKNMSLRKLAEINLRRLEAKRAKSLVYMEGLEVRH